MSKNYPLVFGYRRKPKKDMDGSKNYGKPCVFCGGEMWVQMSCMRGEDETARVCAEHWNKTGEEVIEAFKNFHVLGSGYDLAN